MTWYKRRIKIQLDQIINNENLDNCILFMDTQGFEGHVLLELES